MQLRHAARTDAGKTRDHNEDSYGVEASPERAAAGALFVVCDGIGGFASGEVASDLAVKTIMARYYGSDTRDAAAALVAAFEETNRLVFDQGGGRMGTTSVAALFRDDAVTVANVGDCRAYLIRAGKPRQITRDHSFVAEQVAAGMLTEAQARESSYRNIITRAIGHRPAVEVDTFREPLLKDDIVVLCSDGLHGQVSPEEIALAVTRVALNDACARLVNLANDRGGPDNITIVAIRVVGLLFRTEPVAVEPAPEATARLVPSQGTADAVRGATERLQPVYGPPPAIERRKGERRAVVPPTVTAAPQPVNNPLRGLLLYIFAALVLAVVLFGGYYYLALGGDENRPAATPAPRPTLTRTGDPTISPAVPTLVSTTPAP